MVVERPPGPVFIQVRCVSVISEAWGHKPFVSVEKEFSNLGNIDEIHGIASSSLPFWCNA